MSDSTQYLSHLLLPLSVHLQEGRSRSCLGLKARHSHMRQVSQKLHLSFHSQAAQVAGSFSTQTITVSGSWVHRIGKLTGVEAF